MTESPTKITFEELRTLIEQSGFPENRGLDRKKPFGGCAVFSDWFTHDYFQPQNIETMTLDTGPHAFVVVDTIDLGPIIFDPTFCQFFPDYETYYFLGTPKALLQYIESIGGLETNISHYHKVSARDAYFGAKPLSAPYMPEKPREAAAYLTKWAEALSDIEMTKPERSRRESARAQDERSKKQQSP